MNLRFREVLQFTLVKYNGNKCPNVLKFPLYSLLYASVRTISSYRTNGEIVRKSNQEEN